MIKVEPFETYKTYIALKTHFMKNAYDYIQNRTQRIKAKEETYNKRRDRHYFERLSRQHNDANIISIGSRLTKKNTALKLVSVFLKTKFEGGRHQRRVKKI